MNLFRLFVGSMIITGGVVATINADWGNLAWVACTAIWWRTACGYEDECKRLRSMADLCVWLMTKIEEAPSAVTWEHCNGEPPTTQVTGFVAGHRDGRDVKLVVMK